MAFIKSININLFNGKFNQIIEFGLDLNIISGVNGTGKTKVLQLLKQGKNVIIEPKDFQFSQLKILALSPKRNAEKRAKDSLLSIIRTTDLPKKTQEQINKQIRDDVYDSYPSFAELLHLKFNDLRSKEFNSKPQKNILEEFTNEINKEILSKILPDYRLEISWIKEENSLEIKVYKESSADYLNLLDLSTGEQELLSLTFNIYLMKDVVDVYLIDEPEIHLNWTLEENLFKFLNEFSKKFKKQIIISTHSRIIFDPDFKDKAIYLIWKNGKIEQGKSVPEEYKIKIAGETLKFLPYLELKEPTIIVEDNEHEIFLRTLIEIYGKDPNSIKIIKVNSSTIVETLYQKILSQVPRIEEEFFDAYWLVDGDNKGRSSEGKFIRLKKYSIESYFLNFEILSELYNASIEDIKREIIDILKLRIDKVVADNKNKPFIVKTLKENLNDLSQESLDKLDCSEIFKEFLQRKNEKLERFMQKYLLKARELNILETLIDQEIFELIKNI